MDEDFRLEKLKVHERLGKVEQWMETVNDSIVGLTTKINTQNGRIGDNEKTIAALKGGAITLASVAGIISVVITVLFLGRG